MLLLIVCKFPCTYTRDPEQLYMKMSERKRVDDYIDNVNSYKLAIYSLKPLLHQAFDLG